jgi:predicted nucleic acid-binding protein
MSAEHIFVDTNILVYAHDADAGDKHKAAAEKVAELWDRPYPPAISAQVLEELYVTLARKQAPPKERRRITDVYLEWEIVPNDGVLFEAAVTLHERFQLSLWDALIVAAAQRARATLLWTEDLQDGQRFDTLRVKNPLKTPNS